MENETWRPQAAGWLGEPWPTNLTRDDSGMMCLAGHPLPDLAAEFGTPAYLIDQADFQERATAYRNAFQSAFADIGSECHLYYASKANLNKTLARWATELGFGVDTASQGELEIALAAGVDPAHIGFHGNNKSEAEIELAVKVGVGQIIVDSLQEIERVARIAAAQTKVQPVLVRLTTGVHAGGHEYISTAHEDQKFGLSIHPAPGAPDSPAMAAFSKVLAEPSLFLKGFHSHIGSQIVDPAGFKASAIALVKVRAELAKRKKFLVSELNFGGGYGIAYLPGETAFDPRIIAKALATTVADACRSLGNAVPQVAIEPGRSLIGPAGITLYTIGTIKPVHVTGKDAKGFTRTYVSVDGGLSDNIRPMLYQAKYHCELANRVSEAPLQLCRIVGKHCESGDILVSQVMLPSDTVPGDLLALAATGAYGRSMASNYNMLVKPPVVAVGTAEAKLLVRRETTADLLALDLG
jgi:diaminopimelate decarboxylase